jgi:hypothetical protein
MTAYHLDGSVIVQRFRPPWTRELDFTEALTWADSVESRERTPASVEFAAQLRRAAKQAQEYLFTVRIGIKTDEADVMVRIAQ